MTGLIVLTTSPDLKTAQSIAQLLIEKKAAACVSFKEGFRSYYRWKGKMERVRETLLLIKTTPKKFHLVEKLIKKNHPYEVPEVISLAPAGVSKAYGAWIESVLK